MNFSNFTFIIEVIGTVAFATSGAILAVKKDYDILGIIIMGVVAATGGGIIRDLIIGINPPVMFVEPVYAGTAALTSILVFLVEKYGKKISSYFVSKSYDDFYSLSDALGLGIFTVVGMNSAVNQGYMSNSFLVIFLGVITGVGGGMLRDIMACDVPQIFSKHVYATASIIGAIIYYMCYSFLIPSVSTIISIAATVVIRMLARHYMWNLPRV